MYSLDLQCGDWSRNIEVIEEELPERSPVEEEVKKQLMHMHELLIKDKGKEVLNNVSYSYDSAWDSVPFTAHKDNMEWEVPADLIRTLVGDAILLPNQHKELSLLISEFKDLWDVPTKPIDVAIGHVIELEPNAIPPYQSYYRVGPREEGIIEKIVKEWLAEGIIEHCSDSPFSAPCLLVKKHDGTYRLVIDYRRLNKVTKKNQFPIEDVNNIMSRLQGSRYFF